MGLLDRLLGRETAAEPRRAPARAAAPVSDDERALERYRYLVRTAPPERIEEAHREAFERLTPEQRRLALQELSQDLPEDERPTSDEPQALARAATRAEMRRPGSVERAFGRGGMAGGMGSFLPMFATVFLGTLAAQALFSELSGGDGGDSGSGDQGADEGASADGGDAGGGDVGGGDIGGGGFDLGGGGDFGGF